MAISYVGGQVGGRVGAASTTTITYALTGGSNSTPQAGDLVIVTAIVGSAGRNPAQAITDPATWTALGQLNPNTTTYDTCLNVSYKFMPATPDTTFTMPSTGNAQDAQRWTIQVFRGVDPTNPLDVAAVAASGTATGRPNPGSITPTTAGAWVVICGGGAAATGAAYTAPANYTTNFLTGTTADTNDAMVGSGYRAWTSGAEDPAQYTGGTTNAVDSWAAYTIALRPQAATTHATTGTLVGQGSTVAGSATRTAAPVTHATSGDLVGQGAVVTGSAARSGSGGEILQTVESHDLAGAGSISTTITGVSAGSALVAFAGFDDGSGGYSITGVSDGTAYAAAADGKCRNTSVNQASQVFYLLNAGSGSHTITATFNVGTVTYRRLRVVEIAGIASSGAEDGAANQPQDNQGSTTDSISSSATSATSNANDFILGLTQNCSDDYGGGAPAISAGTGFTLASGTDTIMAAEGKNVSATGAQTATFTAGGNQTWTTHVLALKVAAAGPITHATTGALVGSGATVAGSAQHKTLHTSTGALVGSGSTVVGAANRFRAHPTTGALVGQGSTVTGSASRSTGAVTHDTSGTLVGPGAAVTGAAARFRAFATSGALVGQGSVIAGVSARFRAHPTTGALVGPGATIAGTARHNVPHSTTGALVGSGSTVTGAAARNTTAVTHDTTGALTGSGATVSGAAARARIRTTTGALVGQGSTVAGSANRFRAHAAAGALVGQGATIAGAARHNVPHATTGALVGDGAQVSGAAVRSGSGVTITGASLDMLREIWARLELDPANPVVITSTTLQVGTIAQDIGTGGAVRTGATLSSSKDPDAAIIEIWQRLGLDPANALIQTTTTIDAGPVHCAVTEAGGTVTVQRT